MDKDDKLKNLKDRIQTAETINTPRPSKKKIVGLDLVLKLAQKS